jgi:hypothetical protein
LAEAAEEIGHAHGVVFDVGAVERGFSSRAVRLETIGRCAYSEGMKNITLTLDDDVYSKADEKAVTLHTSVGEVAVDYLRRWASEGASVEQARQHLATMFAQPNWRFAVGAPDDRTLRNARR